jgi:Flp pilus assembly protein CpaB
VRASTLFALSLALLIALGAAVAVKVSGVLNPPPPPAKSEIVQVQAPNLLVAARNLHAGDSVSVGDVRLRPMTLAEYEEYKKSSAGLLPAVTEAALFRQIVKDIEAGQVLKEDMLEPINKPKPLHSLLLPLTRAIDVQIARENSAAGLIQVDDWVDVYLTSDVGRTDEPGVAPRTALLARGVKVVAKRGTLYKTYAPLPQGLISFTLAANPYRAALIDYARSKGTLSLQPVSQAEKKRLDEMKSAVEMEPEKVVELGLPPDSPEAKAELKRMVEYQRGQAAVGDEDLMRIFELKPLTPPTPPQTVEYYKGIGKQGADAFVTTGGAPTRWAGAQRPASYTFQQPKAHSNGKTPS